MLRARDAARAAWIFTVVELGGADQCRPAHGAAEKAGGYKLVGREDRETISSGHDGARQPGPGPGRGSVVGMRENLIRNESLMVSYAVANGWTVVEVDGDVDIHTAGLVREAVVKLLDQGHVHFVLDLGFVTFMDSMGLGAIIAVTKRVQERAGSLRIASASARTARVFELTGLSETYEFFPSADEATRDVPVPGGAARWLHAG